MVILRSEDSEAAEPLSLNPSPEESYTRPRKENGLAVVLPYPERDEALFYDSISVITADGQVTANYRKTHLYGAAERRNYSFGQELPPVVSLNDVEVGILNCYECEFPPLYQYLAERGAKIVLGPTAADGHFRLADGTMSCSSPTPTAAAGNRSRQATGSTRGTPASGALTASRWSPPAPKTASTTAS
ncbi:nitrilase-related carbon-nitrogen hydrolase [Streptomyces sp. ADMS]|uniref:nitrilase-related carbon-nitrogen hydrolase n=1 Tax=Streptomyces sp. ADMS TaxID=3071415 RepID=UPI00296F6415|nr:nitrilase-related carbon-nitrogen hydrolase [Streptomyces sp. ADMS]MDW4910911.1 nitrilase-related carbon-nitrogen hydrolase [Streptomyces sp. ADMS]